MKQFKDDVLHWKDYDFTVINDKIEKCYKTNYLLYKKTKKNKKTLKFKKEHIKNHINKLIN